MSPVWTCVFSGFQPQSPDKDLDLISLCLSRSWELNQGINLPITSVLNPAIFLNLQKNLIYRHLIKRPGCLTRRLDQ
jgi:hypothetical protein